MIRREYADAEMIEVKPVKDNDPTPGVVLQFGEIRVLIEGDVDGLIRRIQKAVHRR